MRYSAIQDDKYGIGCGQETIPSNNNVDDSMMAATGEVEPVGQNNINDSTMIYNLPLLFANGYPTSLDTISLPQLEKFITFMVQCSVGHDRAQVITKPPWWPKEIEFSIPFVRPQQFDDSWTGNLKKLVYQCYTYHKSEYLLRFCSYLAQYPREKIYYVNNWDLTTSLYHKNTGKLLATFRNENMDYDKVVESPRRSLLSHSNSNTNSATKKKKAQQKKHGRSGSPSSIVVLQPQMEEIYLCDNCDAEFGDLVQMKNHEKTCGASMKISESSRSSSPCEVNDNKEPELNQSQFLDYFKLYTGNEPPEKTSSSPITINYDFEPRRSSRRMRSSVQFTRCPTIPFSSPAGIAMARKTKTMTEETQQERIDRIERHMSAPPLSKVNRPKWLDKVPQFNRWVVTYKSNKENLPSDNFVHQYTFGATKRKPLLSIQSQLLYAACGSTSVRLERLTYAQLEDLKCHPWKYRRPKRQRSSKYRSSTSKIAHEVSILDSERTSCNYSIELESPVDKKFSNASSENGDMAKFRSRPIQRLLTQPTESKAIMLVDLCSSDDDTDNDNVDSNCISMLSDENCYPLCISGDNARNAFLKNLALETTQYSSNGHVISKGNDQCNNNNNKRINNVLDTCKLFSSVCKPTP